MSEYQHNKIVPLFEEFCKKNQVDGREIEVKLAGKMLRLKVATTPQSQAKGFMGATSAPEEGEGIIFIYDGNQPLSFWMKNVCFPLDIIFFDSAMQYVGHETMSPTTGEADHKLPRYFSKKPARFAVEVTAGWFDKYGTEKCDLTI